jgi:NTE family protein
MPSHNRKQHKSNGSGRQAIPYGSAVPKDRDKKSPPVENVLVMQGGGSLGAYECGVYKSLEKHGIQFDIVAGTSIGAINAAIIAAGRMPDKDSPDNRQSSSAVLEHFWLSLAEAVMLYPPLLLPLFPVPDIIRMILASTKSFFWGHPMISTPKWLMPFSSDYFFPFRWPFIYDIEPLKNTLNRYIDFEKLRPDNDHSPRLIVTATNIQKGDLDVFDSNKMKIDAACISGCAAYVFYGISWSERNGAFLWDGSLQRNTPVMSVIDSSPERPKKLYIGNVFPKRQNEIPTDLLQSVHRARDILFEDKTNVNTNVFKSISEQISLLDRMYEMLERAYAMDTLDKDSMESFRNQISPEYDKISTRRGAVIDEMISIQRQEKVHYLFEDADFSLDMIKQLIREGEQDTDKILEQYKERDKQSGPRIDAIA